MEPQLFFQSHHAAQPMPEVLRPTEVNISIDAPSDSDSSRRQSYQAGSPDVLLAQFCLTLDKIFHRVEQNKWRQVQIIVQ